MHDSRRRRSVWLSALDLGTDRDLHLEADKPVSACIEEASRFGRINA